MASTSTNNDGRPKRKRLAKACDACHKSKRRCDGMSPCANCFYATKTCTYTDNNGKPVPAPRATMHEQPQIPQQHQSQSQQQPYYHSVSTKRHRQDGPSSLSQPQQTQPVNHPRARVPMEINGSIIRELVNLFFTHCHPALAMIHKPSFTNALSLNQVPPYLTFAICSLSARFSKQPSLHEKPDRFSGREFADEAERMLFEDQDAVGRLIVPPCLQAAQALTILSIFEILSTTHKSDADEKSQPASSGKGKEPEKPGVEQWARGERYRDLSLHIVQALGAHLPDHPSLTSIPTQTSIESSIERESIRRVFWYIYMVDLLRGTYYRWEATKKGGAGSGYAGSGVSLDSLQAQGADPNTFGFTGPAATPRQVTPNFPAATSSLANALGLHEGVMGFSEAELKLRLPVDETSFELGTIHESLPEYLYLSPMRTPYASEFGHVIRVMTIHQKVEQCLGDVAKIDRQRSSTSPPTDPMPLSRSSHPYSNPADPHHHPSRPPSNFPFPPPPPLDYRQNQRRQAATYRLFECERVLNEWSESLPQQLEFTETNLHVHKSMFETSSNMSAWCWACMHTVFASCSLALAVGFRGIKVNSQTQHKSADGRKPGEQSKDRKDMRWAVERLHIVLDLMGERAKFSMILGAVIWPLMRYVHQDDAQMKAWDDLYEDYTGVRMTDLTGGKWEEEPILGPKGPDIPPLGKIPSQSPTHLYPSSSTSLATPLLEGPSPSNGLRHFPVDSNIGIAPSLVSKLPISQPTPSSPSQAQPLTPLHHIPLPSLKSSGLLDWQGSVQVHVPPPSPVSQPGQSTPGPPLPSSSAATSSQPGSSQTRQPAPSASNESNQGRTGLSWMMNS